MIEILKKQWFVVLIALIFICFAIYSAYDSNKGKLPGKSVDGKDVVAALSGNTNITADDLYKNLESTSGKNMLYMRFQAEIIDKSVKTTDALKKDADSLEKNIQADANSKAASAGTDAKTMISQEIVKYGFQYDELDKYCMTVAKMETMQNDYIDKHLDELFTPMYEKKKPRIVSHILITMKDANKPTDAEKKKVKEVEDALKKGTSFADVAKKYSDDKASKDNGGYLGYMDTDTQYVQSFKDAAFKLKKGEISPWVKESNANYSGWHMIKVDETDKKAIETDKKAKPSLYTAISKANPTIANKYLLEASKKLNIKYANDDVKKEMMNILDAKQ